MGATSPDGYGAHNKYPPRFPGAAMLIKKDQLNTRLRIGAQLSSFRLKLCWLQKLNFKRTSIHGGVFCNNFLVLIRNLVIHHTNFSPEG